MHIFMTIGSDVFGWRAVKFQVFPLTFDVVLITLWHYRVNVCVLFRVPANGGN